MILFWVICIYHITSKWYCSNEQLTKVFTMFTQPCKKKYVFTWRLHYNPSKVVFIVFNKTKTCSVSHRVKLFESDISKPDSTVYAGYLLQSNIKCDKLTERVKLQDLKFITYILLVLMTLKSIQLCLQKYGNNGVSLLLLLLWNMAPLTISHIQMLEYIQRYFFQNNSRIFKVFKFSTIWLWLSKVILINAGYCY